MKRVRLCVVGDVAGQGDYHLGDEAMLEANLAGFRARIPDIQFTVFSRDPAWTSRRYGVDSMLPPRAPFGPSDAIRKALRESEGLVVSGGGNLCSTWPDKVLERVVLIEEARALGRPVAIVGQTIGPTLTPAQTERLSACLPYASYVGLRDNPSCELALALGVPRDRVHRQPDDAFLLDPEPVSDGRADGILDETRPIVLLTLDASFGLAVRQRALAAIAGQIDAIAACLDAVLVFVPHVGGRDVSSDHADITAAHALRRQLRTPLIILDVWQPREVRWLVAQASLVVSTRYHPLIFATAAGVCSLGIHSDVYTRTKLRGAMEGVGLEGWCLPLEEAERGGLLPAALELWHRRDAVVSRLVEMQKRVRACEPARWQQIGAALKLRPAVASTTIPCPAFTAAGEAMSGGRPEALSEEQWRQFDRDGYVSLGQMLDASQLDALRKRLDDIMLGRVCYQALQKQLDTGGRYEDLPEPTAAVADRTLAFRKIQGLEVDPLVLALIRHPLFREVCARVYGRHASISIFRAMMMNKPARKGTHLPWHQDAGDVWKLDRDPLLTSWIALDPATRHNGCVQVIPGSHRLGLLSKNGSTISAAHAEQYCPEEKIAHLEVRAGEAIVLHNWLIHRSGINETDTPRRALSACYMDGRTLNTTSGTRFSIVFGEPEEVGEALPFIRAMNEQQARLSTAVADAQRWAESLAEDNERRGVMFSEAQRYALALEEELAQIRGVMVAR